MRTLLSACCSLDDFDRSPVAACRRARGNASSASVPVRRIRAEPRRAAHTHAQQAARGRPRRMCLPDDGVLALSRSSAGQGQGMPEARPRACALSGSSPPSPSSVVCSAASRRQPPTPPAASRPPPAARRCRCRRRRRRRRRCSPPPMPLPMPLSPCRRAAVARVPRLVTSATTLRVGNSLSPLNCLGRSSPSSPPRRRWAPPSGQGHRQPLPPCRRAAVAPVGCGVYTSKRPRSPASQMHPYSIFVDRDRYCAQDIAAMT